MGNRPKNQAIDRRETALTPERIEIFLADLAEHGIVTQAARRGSPHSTHLDGAASTFYTRKRTDPHFAARWAQALEVADGKLLAEAHRRAVDGVDRRQFFKGERIHDIDPETGERVPVSEKEYSDRLMELMLKARFPRIFIERRAIEHHVAPGGWTISSSDLHCLSDAQTEQLTAIMAAVMEARGEIVADPMIDVTPVEPKPVLIEAEATEDVFPY